MTRERKEIEKDIQPENIGASTYRTIPRSDKIIIELLLDIRDILEVNKTL